MTTPAVSPHITAAATKLVLEGLPKSCPAWRRDQLLLEATTAAGYTGHPQLLRALRGALRYRGKHEYEVEAIEDVMIEFDRACRQT